MSEEYQNDDTWKSEFRSFRKNLNDLFKSVLSSEELENFRNEVRDELQEAVDLFDNAAQDFRESDLGQDIRSDIEDLRERAVSGELKQQAKDELTSVFKILNEEIEKGKNNFTSKE